MHPMFVELYLQADADQDEQDRRRRADSVPQPPFRALALRVRHPPRRSGTAVRKQ